MKERLQRWLDEHPTFIKAYVPVTVTMTLLVSLIEPLLRGGCKC